MRIGPELVRRVAALAALDVSDEEARRLSSQLTRIVDHFEALRTIPDEELPSLPDEAPTPLRPDDPRAAEFAVTPEANAPETAHGHFVVPRVVSREGDA